MDGDIKCAAVVWNLYRWDATKYPFKREWDERDLNEMKEKMCQDRVIFDYLDKKWSVKDFDLSRIPNFDMQYIRARCAGPYQLRLSEDYIHNGKKVTVLSQTPADCAAGTLHATSWIPKTRQVETL